jgi:hypothetical protein
MKARKPPAEDSERAMGGRVFRLVIRWLIDCVSFFPLLFTFTGPHQRGEALILDEAYNLYTD